MFDKMFKGLAILIAAYSFTMTAAAQGTRPSVYLDAQNSNFDTYLAAAIEKKGAPVDIVTDQAKATYVLKASPVEVKKENAANKVVRCVFAYCAGAEDKGTVSVQLIEASSSKIVWAYSVNKERGSGKNEQSMAEATAKHLKQFLEHK
jgi:hypothetical protein